MEEGLSFLYPGRCPRCDRVLPVGGGRDIGFCPACLKGLPVVKDPFCMKCGRQLLMEDEEFCSRCVKESHSYDSSRSLLVYNEDMKRMMYRFKYSERREYASVFARMAVGLRSDWLRYQKCRLIVPVPMFRGKKGLRGYNQAEDLALELERLLGIRSCPELVFRSRNTKPLKGLTEKERRANLKGAFSVNRDALIGFLKTGLPARFLLVDDIYTTGSTVDALAELLKTETKKACGEEARVSVLSVCIGEDA